jgi:cellular nucleic acid-binding protein
MSFSTNMNTMFGSNPYPAPKAVIPETTICEHCDRTLMTKDWAAHKNSKKHRENEIKAAETAKLDAKGIGATADTNGTALTANGAKDYATDEWIASNKVSHANGNDHHPHYSALLASNLDGTFEKSPAKNAGGCFNCGQQGHRKAECPNPNSTVGNGGIECRKCHNGTFIFFPSILSHLSILSTCALGLYIGAHSTKS